ncbi:MAG: glycosyltransferase [Lachnospiraceae bacterium]|nr:glycosyltransferase [Lachnospiraceae bacterium]
MKIALIGPVYPYKGGISHYTGLMCHALRENCALRENHEVFMFSFKLQYPKFLFRKEQKDYRDNSFAVADTNYLINTLNPFNWLASALRIKKLKIDTVIFQWWHPYFAPCYFFMTKFLRKQKIVFICHNVFPHERFLLDKFLTKMVLRSGSRFIVHTHLDEGNLLSVKPNAIYRVNPHPTYNIFKQEGFGTAEARKRLGIRDDIPLLLFFGFVREYKGLKHLLKALPIIAEKLNDIKLFVVGDFAGDKEKYLDLINELGIADCLCLVDDYVSNQEVEKYFAAADLVVLPYESATGSGIAQIAYGFLKPVVVTNVGGFTDIVRDGETGYIVKPQNPEELANAILRYFTEDSHRHDEFCENIKAINDEFSWERMVMQIEELTLHEV